MTSPYRNPTWDWFREEPDPFPAEPEISLDKTWIGPDGLKVWWRQGSQKLHVMIDGARGNYSGVALQKEKLKELRLVLDRALADLVE